MTDSSYLGLVAHLQRFGIRHFSTDEYCLWGGRILGRKRARELERLRQPIVEGRADDKALVRFNDFIADPVVASLVHSMKAGAIIASGLVVRQQSKDDSAFSI